MKPSLEIGDRKVKYSDLNGSKLSPNFICFSFFSDCNSDFVTVIS